METIDLFCDLNPAQVAAAYELGIRQRSYREDQRLRRRPHRNEKAVIRTRCKRSDRIPDGTLLSDLSAICSVLEKGFEIVEADVFVGYVRPHGRPHLGQFRATLVVKLRLISAVLSDARLPWIASVVRQNYHPRQRTVEAWASA